MSHPTPPTKKPYLLTILLLLARIIRKTDVAKNVSPAHISENHCEMYFPGSFKNALFSKCHPSKQPLARYLAVQSSYVTIF